MRMPPLLADFIYTRVCKLKCEKCLTQPTTHWISGTTAISGAVASSVTLVEEKRRSGRARLTCVGRDIGHRELELRRGEGNVWELVSDSREQQEKLETYMVSFLSDLLQERSEWIGTPMELSQRVDPDASAGVTQKKVSRMTLQSGGSKRKGDYSSQLSEQRQADYRAPPC